MPHQTDMANNNFPLRKMSVMGKHPRRYLSLCYCLLCQGFPAICTVGESSVSHVKEGACSSRRPRRRRRPRSARRPLDQPLSSQAPALALAAENASRSRSRTLHIASGTAGIVNEVTSYCPEMRIWRPISLVSREQPMSAPRVLVWRHSIRHTWWRHTTRYVWRHTTRRSRQSRKRTPRDYRH